MDKAVDERADDHDDAGEPDDVDALRERVEQKYDFDNFGPEEMAEMTAEEWEAAFDPDSWITGEELLDRVEADLKQRVLDRDVFAKVERPQPDQLVAYSDEGYAAVYPDGTVEGHGTVLRDVKPSVALCSMDDYEPPAMPEGSVLPEPTEVPEQSGELGNRMLQVVAAFQLLAGIGLIGGWLLADAGLVALFAGLGFIVIGLFLFLVVANARLSDRFRAEEYRNRLRAVEGDEERPEIPSFDEGTDGAESGESEPRE